MSEEIRKEEQQPRQRPKRLWRWLLLVVLLPPLLVLLGGIALYIPAVQDWATGFVESKASEALGMRVEIGKLRLVYPLDLSLREVHLIRPTGDTLARLGRADVSITPAPLLDKHAVVPRINLSTVYYHDIDSLGTETRLRLATARVRDLRLDLPKKDISASSLMGDSVDIYYFSTDTTTSPKKEPLTWLAKVGNIALTNSRGRVVMPLDSLYTAVELSSLGVDGFSLDLAKTRVELSGAKLQNAQIDYAVDAKVSASQYMDYRHISARDLNLTLGKLISEGQYLDLEVKSGNARERSGFEIKSLSGAYMMDSLRFQLRDVELQTSASTLSTTVDIPWKIFKGDTTALMELKVDSRLDIKDVYLLAGHQLDAYQDYQKLKQHISPLLREPVELSLDSYGTLIDLEVEEASLHWADVVELEADGHVAYLLESKRRRGRFTFGFETGRDAEKLLPLAGKDIATNYRLPGGLMAEGRIDLSRHNIELTSKLNYEEQGLSLDGLFDERTKKYQAKVNIPELDASTFAPRLGLGKISGLVDVEGQGLDPLSRSSNARVKARIDRLEYNGKALEYLTLDGNLSKGVMNLALNSFNPGLDFALVMDGLLSRERISTSINIDSEDIDFRALGLSGVELSTRFNLQGELNSDLKDTHRLTATLQDMRLSYDGDTIRPREVALDVNTSHSDSRLRLSSGDLLLSANIGEAPSQLMTRVDRLTAFSSRLQQEIKRAEPMKLQLEELVGALPTVDLDVELGKNNVLRAYLAQHRLAVERLEGQVRMRPTLGIEGHLTARDIRRDTLRLNCIDLALSTERHPRPSLANKTRPDSMRLVVDFSMDKTRFRRQEGFMLRTQLNTSLQDARLTAEMLDERARPYHKLSLAGAWAGDAYQLHIPEGEVLLAGQSLAVNSGNWVNLRKADYFFSSDVRMTGANNALLTLIANHDHDKEQTALLTIQNLRLEDYRSLGLPNLSGTLGGEVNYNRQGSITTQPTITGDLSIQNLSYEGKQLGHFASAFFYEPRNDNSHYITADVSYQGNQALSVNGVYTPSAKDDKLRGSLSLHDFPLELANPFTSQFATYLGGRLKGQLELAGSLSDPRLSGAILSDKGQVELREYATTLRLDSLPLVMEGDKIRFDRYAIYSSVDSENPIYLDGTIGTAGVEKMRANLRVQSDETMLMNQERPKEGQLLYGRLIATTDLRLTGKMNALKIRGQLGINSGTNCTYMMREAVLDATDRSEGLITFKDFADTLFTERVPIEAELGGVDVSMAIAVEPTVRFNVDLTSDGRDYMRMQGGGNLQLRYLPYGEMTLRGRYEMIGGGTLMYTLPVVGSKLFTIDPSGYLLFDGDVANPYIDFIATQKVRAATGEGNGAKTNFNVSIKMKEKLENINLSFDLSAPENLSVQNELAAMSREERGKQAIGLLATGTYLGSSRGGNNLDLNETFAALLQNQLNTVAGSLLSGTDLSLGIDMDDGITGSHQMSYTYSFSRRFYNDRIRVIIGGKIHTGNNVSTREQTLVDNVSVEYQLDKPGERFMQIYHKRVTDNVIEGEYSETGAGIMLRRKLNRLQDIFDFRKKKKVQVDSTKLRPVIRQFTLPALMPADSLRVKK